MLADSGGMTLATNRVVAPPPAGPFPPEQTIRNRKIIGSEATVILFCLAPGRGVWWVPQWIWWAPVPPVSTPICQACAPGQSAAPRHATALSKTISQLLYASWPGMLRIFLRCLFSCSHLGSDLVASVTRSATHTTLGRLASPTAAISCRPTILNCVYYKTRSNGARRCGKHAAGVRAQQRRGVLVPPLQQRVYFIDASHCNIPLSLNSFCVNPRVARVRPRGS